MPAGVPEIVNQRYALLRPLGEGGMGSVYLARDTFQGDRPIALKFLRPEAASSCADLFKDEFRSMARLRHPNLAEVYDFGTVGGNGQHFLTLEYVEGTDLTSLRWPTARDNFDNLVVQCLRALDYIHSRGLLHNDIKPQNILIRPPFLVKVLDFGLAQEEAVAEGVRTGLSGTLHYVAPERFRGAKVDARSDLFSLGVVLYEILTDQLPFRGNDSGGVIAAILEGRPRPLHDLQPEIPARLERLVLTLLARDPAERPASAAAALELLNSGIAKPYSLDTPETYASLVSTGRFIGRDTELATLMNLVRAHVDGPALDDGRQRVVIVSGPSGIGKSRLLREMKHRLQLAGVANLTGRCYEDGGTPFQPFVEILRQLPRDEGFDPPPRLRAILDQALLAGEANRTDERATPQALPETIERSEFIEGLADCLDALAHGRPGVLFVEDLHWGEAPEIELLEKVVQRQARGPWLIIGSTREEEAASAPIGAFLKKFSTASGLRRVALQPLNLAQTTELLASMVPFAERPESLARILADRTEGNPLYLEELMRSLAEEGTIRRSGDAWIAESKTLDTIHLPPSLAGAVVRRLSGLTVSERSLVEALAVFNRPVTASLLARALEQEAGSIGEPIDTLERLRLVTLESRRAASPLVGLSHARIREAIYGGLLEERRRGLHRAVGRAIETDSAVSIDDAAEELSHHYSVVGDRERTVTYSLRAAEKAGALNRHRAVEFLIRALDGLPAEDSARRIRVLHDIALYKIVDLSDYEGGRRHARLLQDEARRRGDAIHEARALRLQGWAASYLGDHVGAIDLGTRALAIARRAGEPAEIGACLNYLGTFMGRKADLKPALEAFKEARGFYESVGDLKGLFAILNNTALCHLGMGEPEEGLRLLEHLMALARENGLTYHYHRYLANLGTALAETGRLTASIETLEESLTWSRRRTGIEQAGYELIILGQSYLQRGRFDRAIALLQEERALRRDAGDAVMEIEGIDFLGAAYRDLGRTDLAAKLHEEGLAAARKSSVRMQEGYLEASLAQDHLRRGETGAAEELAGHALAIADELRLPRIRFHALCVLAEAAASRHDRRAILANVRALTRLETRALRFRDRLHLNLVLGRCWLAAGKAADAEREARASLQAAEKGGYREFEWRSQVLLGDALTARNLLDDAAHAYNAAQAIISKIATEIEDPAMRDEYEKSQERQDVIKRTSEYTPAAQPRPAAADDPKGAPVRMLTTLYEITQIINSILDLKELLNKVMDLAIEIVGAERGLIFLYRSETDEMEMVVARNMERQTIKEATEYSQSILKEAGLGRSILSHDAGADERFKEFRSVTMYKLRSLLCVPLRIRNRILGTVYVDTRKPGVLFSEEDLRFLETFANQAAIAIENARLYDQVRQENHYLRQAVHERYGYENIIGRSVRMREIFSTLTRVSPSTLPVMIRGESGTGKELVARAIHQNSNRRDRKFYTENCAALTDTLLESELFGHVRGAFTGAESSRKGLFEMADGGSLFLDEVGDMSVAMQSKLLRVLQDGEIRPVGSETSRRVDVRVISATNRDLEAMVKQKTFREDLYFRLNVISVRLPSLRERREDIPLLVDHFLAKMAQENKTPKLRVEPTLMAMLTRYDWSGNVRELENMVYKLALFCAGDTLTLEDAKHDAEFYERLTAPGSRGVDSGVTRGDLERALSQANGNRDEAARLLGISRATLFRKLKQHRLPAKHPHPAFRAQSE